MADLSKFNVNNIEYNIKDAYAREQLTNLISLNDIVDKELVKFYFPDLSGGGYSGNCSLVVTPFKTILMDCGPTSDWTAIHSYLNNLYIKEIFNNIDIIIISHYHYDHVENLSNILSSFPHDNCVVYLPLNPTNYNNIPSEVLTQRSNVLNILNTNNINYVEVSQDTLLQFNDNYIKIKLINSSYDDYSYYSNLSEPAVYNNYSMVALIQIGEVYAMFPGDIQRDAQIRIFNQHELPRLFLYCVHHHGIQNDDYIPYLETIQPEYSVIMTSHNRALLSAASSYSGNYFSDFVGSTGFSDYEFVCGKNGGTIVHGLNIPRIGWYYSYVDLYVDNEYNGVIHDGTQEHPFLEINEALMFVKQESNLHYYIRVKGTNTIYDYMWVREFKVPIDILGYKDSGGANVYPSVKGGYIRACTCVNVANLIFNGTGREINTHPTIFYVWSGKVSLVNCTLDGSNLSLGTNKYLLQLRESHAYLNECNFNNSDVGVVSYREGEVTTNIVNFNNVTYCYNVSNLSLYIRGLDTISNVTYWLSGGGRAVSINNVSNVNDTLLAKIYKAVVSQPFYCNDTYPMCMIQGTKIYAIIRTEKDIENSNIYVTPEMYGAIGDGVTDDTQAFIKAFENSRFVILAKNKTYLITSPIVVYEGTTIEMCGSTLLANTTGNHVLHNFKSNDTYLGYSGNGNIAIKNGNIERGSIDFIHGQNIVIENIVFNDCRLDHYIEICACNNFIIRNCSFIGMTTENTSQKEYINIDNCKYDNFPWIEETSQMFDGTVVDGVFIDNCIFDINSSSQQDAIGKHSYYNTNNYAANRAKNIIIRDCKVYGATDQAFLFMGADNVVIENCQIYNCKRNYLIRYCDYVTITNNNVFNMNSYNIVDYSNYVKITNNNTRLVNNVSYWDLQIQHDCNEVDYSYNEFVNYSGGRLPISFSDNSTVTNLKAMFNKYIVNSTSIKSVFTIGNNTISLSFKAVDDVHFSSGTNSTSVTGLYDLTQFNRLIVHFGAVEDSTYIECVIKSFAGRNFVVGETYYVPANIGGSLGMVTLTITDAYTLTSTGLNIRCVKCQKLPGD